MAGKEGAGKGDTPRPLSVSYSQYIRNWERAFGKKKEKKCRQKKK
jgi:hypothetical protein